VCRQHQFNKQTEAQADEMTNRTEQELILHELLKRVWTQNVAGLLRSAVVWRTEQRPTYSSNLPVLLFSVWQRPVSSQMTTLTLTNGPTQHHYLPTTTRADDCKSSTLAGLIVSEVSEPVGRESERQRGGGSNISPPFPTSSLASAGASKAVKSTLEESNSHKETAAITPTKVSLCGLLIKCWGFVAFHHSPKGRTEVLEMAKSRIIVF
jgi:hypothetical protein